MDDKFWGDPWKVLAEPFVQAFKADSEAEKRGLTQAAKNRVDQGNRTFELINKSRLHEALRKQAGKCQVDLIDQRFTGKARELAHKGDELRRLAQLPKGTLRTA